MSGQKILSLGVRSLEFEKKIIYSGKVKSMGGGIIQGEVLHKKREAMEDLISTIPHISDACSTPFNNRLSLLKKESLNGHFITPSKVFSLPPLLLSPLTLIYHHVVSGRDLYKERDIINNQKEKERAVVFEWDIYNINKDHLFYFLRGPIENFQTLDII